MQPVLHRFCVRDLLEPDVRTLSVRIPDAVFAKIEVLFREAHGSVIVVPRRESLRSWYELVVQCSCPEMCEQVGVRAINDELIPDRHPSVSPSCRRPMVGRTGRLDTIVFCFVTPRPPR